MTVKDSFETEGLVTTSGGTPELMAHVPASDAVVTGVTLDSRAVRPGDLYAALPGSRELEDRR